MIIIAVIVGLFFLGWLVNCTNQEEYYFKSGDWVRVIRADTQAVTQDIKVGDRGTVDRVGNQGWLLVQVGQKMVWLDPSTLVLEPDQKKADPRVYKTVVPD